MATIIDALVVTLGLDPKDFVDTSKKFDEEFKRVKGSAQKHGSDIETSGKKAARSLSALRGEVLLLYAAFTGGRGLREFVFDIATGDAQMGRFAKTLDENVEELSTWRNTAEVAGGSAEGIQQSMQSLTDQFQQFTITGESSVIPYFRALGVQMSDLSTGKMRPMTDILLDLADKFSHMDPARAATFGRAMGFDQGTINLLLLGRDALRKLLADQREYGITQKKNAEAGAALQKSWVDLQHVSTSLGRTLLTILAPALIAVLKALTGIAEFLLRHKAILVGVFTALTVAVLALSTAMIVSFAGAAVGAMSGGFALLTGGASSLALGLAVLTDTALPGLSAAFLALGAAIEATPVGWIITGIALLGAAAYELYEHWNDIPGWWAGLWDDMADVTDAAAQRMQQHGILETILSSVGIGGVKRHPAAQGGTGAAPGAGGAGAGPGGGGASQTAWEAAKASEAKYGIPAAVTYAQWALESSYGAHMPAGSNNPFGIKATGNQPSVDAMTTEYINGVPVRMVQAFRKFDSLADAFEAHAKLLATSGRYSEARKHEDDPDAFADSLTGIYATDPTYGTQLRKIMKGLGPKVSASRVGGGQKTAMAGSVHNETRIGSILVKTAATDAKGIARDIGHEIQDHSFASQANYGAA